MRVRNLALLFVLGTSLPMLADTTYTYTGSDFTFASSPFTTSESVTGSFTVASPLGDSTSLHAITPTSYSFNAGGLFTLTNTNSTINDFAVGTDASGNIDAFFIEVINGSIGEISLEHTSVQQEFVIDSSPFGEAGSSSGGTFTSPAATPETGTLGLLGTALLAGAGVVRRRLRA